MAFPKDFYFYFLLLLSLPVYLLPNVKSLPIFLAFLFLVSLDKVLVYFKERSKHTPDTEISALEREVKKTFLNRQLEEVKHQMVIENERRILKETKSPQDNRFAF